MHVYVQMCPSTHTSETAQSLPGSEINCSEIMKSVIYYDGLIYSNWPEKVIKILWIYISTGGKNKGLHSPPKSSLNKLYWNNGATYLYDNTVADLQCENVCYPQCITSPLVCVYMYWELPVRSSSVLEKPEGSHYILELLDHFRTKLKLLEHYVPI
jgi:hypothetical protein